MVIRRIFEILLRDRRELLDPLLLIKLLLSRSRYPYLVGKHGRKLHDRSDFLRFGALFVCGVRIFVNDAATCSARARNQCHFIQDQLLQFFSLFRIIHAFVDGDRRVIDLEIQQSIHNRMADTSLLLVGRKRLFDAVR